MGHCSGFGIALALSAVLMASFAFALHDDVPPADVARAMAAGDPVAVISWLPSEVSNGTWSDLDGSGSFDSDGYIVNYTWSISVNNATTNLWGQAESYKFKTLGLYRITLTVTDNNGSSNAAFTAVYSIVDIDLDGLPDWWEMRYFLIMEEIGSDDYDNDDYTNIEEYASGQDPTVQDEHPGLVQDVKDNWIYIVIAAAIVIGVIIAMRPYFKRKRKEQEQKKIEFAIEIEKALQGEK